MDHFYVEGDWTRESCTALSPCGSFPFSNLASLAVSSQPCLAINVPQSIPGR
jgi:hypothetical protein